MGQEFFINSEELETKIRQLLPSQGGAGAGFDLSASTQIVPIIDLTESAEGSNVRSDLQTALSFASCEAHSINNETRTAIISNTGFFRVFGLATCQTGDDALFELSDSAGTRKVLLKFNPFNNVAVEDSYDFIVFMEAGDKLLGTCGSTSILEGVSRQIADIDGNLVNP
tara:strand:- start:397 stop:903 length:507 start_codon:yes stop_codon:yes gene_type:complete